MNKNTVGTLAFVAGAAIGGVTAWYITKKKLETWAEDYVQTEVEAFKESYLKKTGDFATPQLTYETLKGLETEDLEAAKDFMDDMLKSRAKIHDFGYDPGDDEDIDVQRQNEEEIRAMTDNISSANAFEHDVSDSIDETTAIKTEDSEFYKNRDHSKPFVISIQEFSEDEDDFDKMTVHFYEGDDTLCGEDEQLIPNSNEVIGLDNTHRFGDHSDDENIVYIRNINYGTDYEVVRHQGEYAVLVLGMESERNVKDKEE